METTSRDSISKTSANPSFHVNITMVSPTTVIPSAKIDSSRSTCRTTSPVVGSTSLRLEFPYNPVLS